MISCMLNIKILKQLYSSSAEKNRNPLGIEMFTNEHKGTNVSIMHKLSLSSYMLKYSHINQGNMELFKNKHYHN